MGRLALPRLFDLESNRSAIPAEASRREMVGMKGIAPQGCQILSLDPPLFGFNHMPVNWCIRQDSHLQTLRSKRRMIIISPRMRNWSRWRDSHSRGAMRPAVYETAAVAAEPHRRNGGSPRCCPVLCGLRDRCIAAMLATRPRREGGVEPPQPGL